MTVITPHREFWNGRRVMLTGHTGFKGGWLAIWLENMGAHVIGISLAPNTTPNLYSLAKIQERCESHFCDVRDYVQLNALMKCAQPEIVFHLAAQPLVRQSYSDPLNTFSTNVIGTANLLNAMRGLSSIKVAVMITTDKVYSNKEWLWPYRENDALGGHDPYSASKAASEIVISSYRDSFLADQGIAVASARAGNVIGGGDWSTDRLIPDAVRAWSNSDVLEIRRPDATRPWQHVLEPLAGYLVLAQKLHQKPSLAGAYNFGPHSTEVASVRKVIEIAKAIFDHGKVVYRNETLGPHEAGRLALDIAKSQQMLGYMPRLTLTDSLRRTMAWYMAHHQGADARLLCESDIMDYESVLSMNQGAST